MSAEQIQSHREIRGACQSDAFQSLIVQWQPAGPSNRGSVRPKFLVVAGAHMGAAREIPFLLPESKSKSLKSGGRTRART
jgi:hypothetical protein